MSYRSLFIVILSFLCTSAVSAPPGERYIVQFEDGRGAAGLAAVANVGMIARDLARHNAVAAHIPSAALAGLQRNPNVEFVELDSKRYLYTHLDTQQVTPYGITQAQADLVTESAARTVCVIDSGYDLGHPDLPNMTVGSPPDPLATLPWDEDGLGHGTHVAGTIAALANAEGVVGVLPNGTVGLQIVRVFNDNGDWGYASDLVAALDACLNGTANVVNMSLGGSRKSRFEEQAFNDAYSAGVLSIAAAGNDGNTRKSYPASYDSVVSVAAIDENKQLASFSQRNDQVELAAAGVDVLSTVPRGTGSESDVTVGASSYGSAAIEGSPNGTGSGPLADCGLGTSACAGASGGVCLIQRGDITFAEKVQNCEAGGGTAAIIYNNEPGMLYGTHDGAVTVIPSVGVSDTDGAAMTGQIGDTATVEIGASNYAAWDGTSMATPHVSGVAALVWSNHTSCSNAQIRAALGATAEDLDPAGRDNATGHGLVQAKAAYDLLLTGCDAGGGGGGGGEPPPPSCELLPKGAACTSNDQCCSNKCKGPPGGATCK